MAMTSRATRELHLETYGDDDAYYGYLYFDEEGLGVAYRTREEDTELAFSNEPWEPTYRQQRFDKCSATSLRRLSAPKVVESLVASINARVQEEQSPIQLYLGFRRGLSDEQHLGGSGRDATVGASMLSSATRRRDAARSRG
jgi:hypothetical protein